MEGLFTDGVTDVDFRSNQWAAISMNSGLKTAIEQQTSRVNGGLESSHQENLIGTEITPGTFRTLEGKKTKTIDRDAYGSFNLLKFHLYENGLIVKEYQLGTSKPIQYEVVNEVEEEFDDGGFREIDGYFEGTKLAFVDYLRPHAIVKKGFKLAFISGAKISKYKGDLSVKKIPTVENKSKGSLNGSKEAGNLNKGIDNAKLSPSNYPNPDPPMSIPPVRYEPKTIEEVIRMRQGKGPTTKMTHGDKNIEAHHRQQVPVKNFGILDELEQRTHRGGGNHTRHDKPFQLTPSQRAKEIREHYKERGKEYILPGEGI